MKRPDYRVDTHCPRGHDLKAIEGVYVDQSTGKRQCWQCMRKRHRERERRLAAAKREQQEAQ